MRRVLLASAICLIAIASWRGCASAQEMTDAERYVGQRIGNDAVAIKRLLDENAALKAEIAKHKAEDEKAKAVKP